MWKRLDPKIATSEKHVKLGFGPMMLWALMLPHTDSKGRYWANPAFIKGQCLPLFDAIRLEQVEAALLELEKVGLIHLFDSEGKRYLVYHDVEEFNPPGALRYQKTSWPDPDGGLCRCLSRRVNAVSTTFVPSSSLKEGVQGKPDLESLDTPDSPDSRLFRLAIKAKLRAVSETQLRRYVSGWNAEKGFQFVEALLMNQAIKGKDVLDVNNQYFRPQRSTGKPMPLPGRSFKCQSCGDSGEIADFKDGKLGRAPCNSCHRVTA